MEYLDFDYEFLDPGKITETIQQELTELLLNIKLRYTKIKNNTHTVIIDESIWTYLSDLSLRLDTLDPSIIDNNIKEELISVFDDLSEIIDANMIPKPYRAR